MLRKLIATAFVSYAEIVAASTSVSLQEPAKHGKTFYFFTHKTYSHTFSQAVFGTRFQHGSANENFFFGMPRKPTVTAFVSYAGIVAALPQFQLAPTS